ncbi:MAG: peroxiredoxin [Halovenus sp.]|jgi:peroxiredoxin
MVTTGQKAPDFIRPAVVDGDVELLELFAELREHRAVVLVFEPAAFVPTGTAELRAVCEAGWHEQPALLTVGLTGDSLYSHFAYATQYDLGVPLVSDFHGGVADSYDLLLADWEGHSDIPARATVVIDGDWEVRATEQTGPLDERSPAPVVRATDALQDCGVDVDRPDPRYDL